MDTPLKGRDLLTMADLSPEDLRLILDRAVHQKSQWASGTRSTPHAGKSVALIFMKPSLRTRVSFEVACQRLGVHPVVLGGSDTVFSRGESVYDSVKVLERYVDAICIRTFEHSMAAEIAEIASVPVVNMLTDDHHPCQGLADLLTIEEHFGRLSGLTLTYVGDGNNMTHTYLLGGAIAGMHVVVATPEGYDPIPAIVEQARSIAETTGGRITLLRDPHEAVSGADVVVTDTWASMGQEDEHAARTATFADYRVDSKLMAAASERAVFMHCLPAHRGEEVTDEVIDAPNSLVFDEAENRLHAQKALLSLLLG
ncbi:MAG: ornithine carbamoyltransferase [Coriobacteriia bacterium]|nr:ornithine carbamoyltransferase [Coriobacteriia bacterium]